MGDDKAKRSHWWDVRFSRFADDIVHNYLDFYSLIRKKPEAPIVLYNAGRRVLSLLGSKIEQLLIEKNIIGISVITLSGNLNRGGYAVNVKALHPYVSSAQRKR